MLSGYEDMVFVDLEFLKLRSELGILLLDSLNFSFMLVTFSKTALAISEKLNYLSHSFANGLTLKFLLVRLSPRHDLVLRFFPIH